MHATQSPNRSETKNTTGSFLLDRDGVPPPLLISDGMEPLVSTVERAAHKPSGDTLIWGGRQRGDDATAVESGSRTAAQRPRSPLFRQR